MGLLTNYTNIAKSIESASSCGAESGADLKKIIINLKTRARY